MGDRRMSAREIAKLRSAVWKYYRAHGRHELPWRMTTDPYAIFVSEIMLQQTQVERVITYYQSWMRRFPTVQSLARAPLSQVLRMWQGLGYNRRAKYLKEAAMVVVRDYAGVFPKSAELLEQLPGVGPYTAQAIASFAYNQDGICIETNIRTVVMHHCFSGKQGVSDAQIRDVLVRALPRGKSRKWYFALMDYGSFLKRSGVHTHRQTTAYTKQKKFAGSAREARGAVVRTLSTGPRTEKTLLVLLGVKRRAQVKKQLALLVQEGMVEKARGVYRLPK